MLLTVRAMLLEERVMHRTVRAMTHEERAAFRSVRPSILSGATKSET
jgi:hypothetical protein